MSGNLSGLRVIECARTVSGPFCAKLLADLGAEVIKVETPRHGDPSRHMEPFADDRPGLERSGLYLYLNTNKKGITLDLSKPTGAKILRQLASDADILIEDYPPGQLEEWGLSFRQLHEMNPQLVVVSITPFGQTGPYRDFQGGELISSHTGGAAFFVPIEVPDPQLPPLKVGGRQADFLTGFTAGIVAMGALNQRQRTGVGGHVDLSRHEALATAVCRDMARISYTGVVGARGQSMIAGFSGLLPCKDGFVHIHAREDRHWPNLVDMMGNPEWAKDSRFADAVSRDQNWEALWQHVKEWAAQHTKQEISDWSQERHIACGPVNNIAETFQSAQLQAREFFQTVDHPVMGRVTMPGPPCKFDRDLWGPYRPAPQLGEHNAEILCERLGYGREELVKLAAAGII